MWLNDQNYVDEAEKVIIKLSEKKDRWGNSNLVTISKLRNLLNMTTDIYNEVLMCREDRLSEGIGSRIEYLRVRFLYEAGRDEKVRELVKEAKIIGTLKEIGFSRKNYILFSRYMEALVAFHRYYGGKD